MISNTLRPIEVKYLVLISYGTNPYATLSLKKKGRAKMPGLL